MRDNAEMTSDGLWGRDDSAVERCDVFVTGAVSSTRRSTTRQSTLRWIAWDKALPFAYQAADA
jgi:hypothetical protein